MQGQRRIRALPADWDEDEIFEWWKESLDYAYLSSDMHEAREDHARAAETRREEAKKIKSIMRETTSDDDDDFRPTDCSTGPASLSRWENFGMESSMLDGFGDADEDGEIAEDEGGSAFDWTPVVESIQPLLNSSQDRDLELLLDDPLIWSFSSTERERILGKPFISPSSFLSH